MANDSVVEHRDPVDNGDSVKEETEKRGTQTEIGSLIKRAVNQAVGEFLVPQRSHHLVPITTDDRVEILEQRTRDLEWTLYGVLGLFIGLLLVRGLRS